jgi:UDP-2,4-diacetamido-2,4,6-trideoxy-beta-L-altropyranose hydrolase
VDLRVRPANLNDTMLLFAWVNDPYTRRNSFNSDPIPLQDHQKWFKLILHNADAVTLIIEGKESELWIPVAVFRVNSDAEVAFAIALEYRGRHLV